MELINIILIIIGLVIIFISYKLMDNAPSTMEKGNTILDIDSNILEESIKQRIDSISSETIYDTKEKLNGISNEKIIAINEFSEQILEKIKNNHEEVVFLYKMLIEKEENIKKIANIKNVEDVNKIKEVENINEHDIESQEKISNLELNNNKSYDEILRLYKEGKTILEISKFLNIGQGEVKLVIDLEAM